jgi:hypothetical protein
MRWGRTTSSASVAAGAKLERRDIQIVEKVGKNDLVDADGECSS